MYLKTYYQKKYDYRIYEIHSNYYEGIHYYGDLDIDYVDKSWFFTIYEKDFNPDKNFFDNIFSQIDLIVSEYNSDNLSGKFSEIEIAT